jgi:sensor histidine kinase regulating citrate/malate metabolism
MLSVLIVARIFKVYEREALFNARLAIADSFNSLAESMRMQNDGFLGHLEKIAGFCREGRYEDLEAYLDGVAGQISVLNDVLQVDNPVIGALLKAKATEADVRRIRLNIEVSTSLSELGGKVLPVARIIGNLLDNALDATAPLAEQDRVVGFSARRDGPLLRLDVVNRGQIRTTPPERVFEPGYTTKGEGHGGLGLYIVKDLAEALFGTVKVSSDEAVGTRFTVTLPG